MKSLVLWTTQVVEFAIIEVSKNGIKHSSQSKKQMWRFCKLFWPHCELTSTTFFWLLPHVDIATWTWSLSNNVPLKRQFGKGTRVWFSGFFWSSVVQVIFYEIDLFFTIQLNQNVTFFYIKWKSYWDKLVPSVFILFFKKKSICFWMAPGWLRRQPKGSFYSEYTVAFVIS